MFHMGYKIPMSEALRVMLIFQIELPGSALSAEILWSLCKESGVGSLRHFSIACMESAARKKNILTVNSTVCEKHGKDSGVVLLAQSLCVQYHAYRRANNTLQGWACSARRKVPASGFGCFRSQHCLVLDVCHILMECWVRRIQLPSGLGKNSSHGKTKGYKYHPNLPAAAPAFCGK